MNLLFFVSATAGTRIRNSAVITYQNRFAKSTADEKIQEKISPTERSAGNTGLFYFPNMDFYRDPFFQVSLARRKWKVHVRISCKNNRPNSCPASHGIKSAAAFLPCTLSTQRLPPSASTIVEGFNLSRLLCIRIGKNSTLCIHLMIKITRIAR